MTEDRHLRAVAPEGMPGDAAIEPAAPRRRPSWLVLALVAALVLSILLLAWGRVWYERRVTGLEAAAAALRAEVERHEGVIEAQRARLTEVGTRVDDVRARIEELSGLLGSPLPEVD